MTVGNTKIDRNVKEEDLRDAGLISEADYCDKIKNEHYYESTINKPVIIWGERWKVKVSFEYNDCKDFCYCATILSLYKPEDEKKDFLLMKAYGQKAFGTAHRKDSTEYIFENKKNVYLRKRSSVWLLIVSS